MEKNNTWQELLISHISQNSEKIKRIKQIEAEARQLKKEVEGTAAKPSEYAEFKKQLLSHWDTVIDKASTTEDKRVSTEGNVLKLALEGQQLEVEVKTSKRVDQKKVLDKLVIDGLVSPDVMEKYLEDNTKEVKSFYLK